MKVFIENIKSYDYDKVRQFLQNVATEISLWKQLEGKNIILLKPNMLGAYEPKKAVTTHPLVLEVIIDMLLEHGKEVMIGDSPGGTTSVQQVYESTGIKELTHKKQVELVNFSDYGVVNKKTKNHNFGISKYIYEADAVINVAKYKTHSLMYYTGAIKNLYGTIPGLKKSDYHKQNPELEKFSTVISELYLAIRPKLILNIVDGIIGMEGEGPSAGEVRRFNIMFASQSGGALDLIAGKMMGFKTEQLKYITEVMKAEGVKEEQIEIDKHWRGFQFKNVKIKRVSAFIKILAYSPTFLKNIFRKLYFYYPAFDERKCRLCKVCEKSCPVQAITIKQGAVKPVIDYNKCIKCMCCHELCPYQAVYIKKSLLAKILLS
ncbi:MAG: DUF362 domain-containing protein [Candidatus Cloacimonadota bacterium]|nr:DUF362 domain-containing protein [Candidatus Cloacimonadota bacterium]